MEDGNVEGTGDVVGFHDLLGDADGMTDGNVVGEGEQKLHVARHVLATEGFSHSISFLLALLPCSQEQSLSHPFSIKNVPWESEQPYNGHLPQTSGQCEPRTPV